MPRDQYVSSTSLSGISCPWDNFIIERFQAGIIVLRRIGRPVGADIFLAAASSPFPEYPGNINPLALIDIPLHVPHISLAHHASQRANKKAQIGDIDQTDPAVR